MQPPGHDPDRNMSKASDGDKVTALDGERVAAG
jgi:hypothetical protein